MPRTGWPPSIVDPSQIDSSAHRQLTNEAAIKDGRAAVDDLDRFAAVPEQRKAWATRLANGAEGDDVGFVQQRGGWKIRFFARRPQR